MRQQTAKGKKTGWERLAETLEKLTPEQTELVLSQIQKMIAEKEAGPYVKSDFSGGTEKIHR